jgi:long-chain acyl-CoA synthetase
MNIGDRIHGCPTNPALVFVKPNGHATVITYSQLEERIDNCRAWLRELGFARGDSLALLADNSDAFVIAWYAALREGLVVVPVNHKLLLPTITHIIKDSGAVGVLVDQYHADKVPACFLSAAITPPKAGLQDRRPSQMMENSDRAVVLYTSGSTGMPKGVPMDHSGYNWTIDTRLKGDVHHHHRLLVAAPLYHINALGAVTFALAAGACVVLLQRFEAKVYLQAIDRHRCTWLTSVPAMLAMVVRESEALSETDLSSVQSVRMGSSPVSDKLFAQVRAVFGEHAVISNAYGTTEGGPLVFGASPEGKQPPVGSVGWPLAGVHAKLVDAQGNESAECGELVHKTPATMKGYLNLPDKTQQVLSADGWYSTGDIFRRDEQGAYWFVSRVDDMFVCGGENLHPQEVERVLEMHADVQQVCVVPIADEIKGAKPVAFIVKHPGAEVSAEELKLYALSNGPAYQHPRHIFFVDRLPLAGTNKIDRKELMKQAQENLE